MLIVVRHFSRLQNCLAVICKMADECDPDAEEVMNLQAGIRKLAAVFPS